MAQLGGLGGRVPRHPLQTVVNEGARPAIFPSDASLIRFAGAMLIEQNDEWLVSRRYLSQESLSSILDENDHSPTENKEVPALSAA